MTESTVALPLMEDFDEGNATPDCWSADPAWAVFEGAYRLLPTDEQTDDNTLALPALSLEADQTYMVSFRYRALAEDGGGRLMLSMVGEEALFDDRAAPAEYQYVEALVTPGENGVYAMAFSSPRDEMSEGLLVDDVSVMVYAPPTMDGATELAGLGDDVCTSVRAQGVNGMAWMRVLTDDGKLLAEINANGNALGDVEVSMTDYTVAPTAPFTGAAQLGRYYSISPENGGGPYTENGGVMIRLYVTDDELTQLETASGETLDWNDLIVTHYNGDNGDCDLLNSTDATALMTEDVTATGDYGATAHYVEFMTQSFSEFGITYQEAVSVTPGWAEPFAGLEAFPVPAGDRLTVRLTTRLNGRVALRLTDALGRSVRTMQLDVRAGKNQTELSLSGLPGGAYQLTATDGVRAGTLRIVKRGL